ncbi:MAG: hypothetical protein JWM34_4698 [Ilumatobacteraceae bacterium]|nr:hypothetical protein [Ilumatobacteraceae bacterium]
MHITDTTMAMDRWMLMLNAHGSIGWEVVGITAADPTIGVNSFTAVLKRETRSYPPPADTAAAWHPDPAGRHELRHWDGLRWTEHVSTAGETDKDYPNVR